MTTENIMTMGEQYPELYLEEKQNIWWIILMTKTIYHLILKKQTHP